MPAHFGHTGIFEKLAPIREHQYIMVRWTLLQVPKNSAKNVIEKLLVLSAAISNINRTIEKAI